MYWSIWRVESSSWAFVLTRSTVVIVVVVVVEIDIMQFGRVMMVMARGRDEEITIRSVFSSVQRNREGLHNM